MMRSLTVSLGTLVVGALIAGCSGGSGTRTLSTAAPLTSGVVGAAASSSGSGSTNPGASVGLPSGTLNILSYNVAGLPQGLSSSSPVTNTPQISPLLDTYALVLVQEDFWYHTELQKDAGHPFQSLPLTQHSTVVNDGLNRFSQSPFLDHTRVKWDDCYGLIAHGNDCLSSKGFSVARHELGSGAVVDVYNLHADAGGGTKDQNARTLQFAQLARFMAVFSQDKAVIVGGDTNLDRSTPIEVQLLDDFLGTAGLQEVGLVISGTPDHIDRFFFRSSLDLELVPSLWRVADEFVDPSGQPLSDHPAIHVDFDWRRLR